METKIFKKCLKCKLEKECFNFCINKKTTDGLNKICKECKNLYDKTRREKHKSINNCSINTSYRAKNLESFLRCSLNSTKQGAKRRNIEFSLSLKEIIDLFNSQKGLCAISKIPMTSFIQKGHCNTNISIDRIDSSKDYTIDNVQLLCYIVNVMKHNNSIKDLLYFCKAILINNRN